MRLALAALSFALCACGDFEEASKPIGTVQGATYAEFEKLTNGMTYEQVCTIIGGPGKEMSSSEFAGIKTVMYAWDGEGGFGANMNAMFQNEKLMQKAQFGLK
jgi:hypothetical protein